jgi:hypothetical protein
MIFKCFVSTLFHLGVSVPSKSGLKMGDALVFSSGPVRRYLASASTVSARSLQHLAGKSEEFQDYSRLGLLPSLPSFILGPILLSTYCSITDNLKSRTFLFKALLFALSSHAHLKGSYVSLFAAYAIGSITSGFEQTFSKLILCYKLLRLGRPSPTKNNPLQVNLVEKTT